MLKEFLRVPVCSLSPGDRFFIVSSFLPWSVPWILIDIRKDSSGLIRLQYLIIPFQRIHSDYFYSDDFVYVPLED